MSGGENSLLFKKTYGALVGGAIGAVAGGLIGNEQDKADHYRDHYYRDRYYNAGPTYYEERYYEAPPPVVYERREVRRYYYDDYDRGYVRRHYGYRRD